MPRDNHTDTEYLKTIGLERSNTQWSAVMLKENHDLYTASQLYLLTLSAKEFTQEEAEKIAETVSIK